MSGELAALVFDVGGVLFHWNPRYLYEKLIDDPDRLDWFLDNVVTLEWHFQHDAGRSAADCAAELIARFPEERDLIEIYDPRWLETIPGPVEGMPELVEELSDLGIPLFAITNFSAEFYPRFAEWQPVMSRFRDVIVSGAERLVKPDPAIYALALGRFALEPYSALFIDDRQDNIEAARANGFLGHRFSDASALRTLLRSHGIGLKP